MSESIVAFFRMESPDNCGRMIVDIWNYSDRELEDVHDYIQWLFPLFEESAYSLRCPLLTVNSAKQIIADEICKSSFRRSLSVMRSFYKRNLHWAKSGNHNLLRITRILKSTALLLGKASSIEFYNLIMMRCNELEFIPSIDTIDFWENATAAELVQYHENC